MKQSEDLQNDCVRCLVVDDFERWRQQICALLKTRPQLQVVAEATNGVEAIRKAEELLPDVIMMDIALPDLNGIAAASEIIKKAPNSKIIFVSQLSDSETVKKALSDGGYGYVWKPDVHKELLTAVEQFLLVTNLSVAI